MLVKHCESSNCNNDEMTLLSRRVVIATSCYVRAQPVTKNIFFTLRTGRRRM